jgi:CDP-diacylglycerol--glycerol-3-phosphate 3-phosphatidyltransferase
MLEGLKPVYNAFLRPMLRLFVMLRLSPNHLTLAGVAIFMVTGLLTALGEWYWAFGCALLGAFADGWDGLLAREYGKTSRFGAVLDSVADRVTEIVWLGGFLYFFVKQMPGTTLEVLLCFVAMSGSLLVSYVKARAEAQGARCSGGMLQRPERLIVLMVALLIGPHAALGPIAGVTLILALLSLFSYWTVAQRMVEVYRDLQ